MRRFMRRFMLVLAVAALAGCGVETVTSAATGAAIKKQEIEAGKTTMQQAQQKLEQSMQQSTQQTQQRAEE